MSEERSDIGNVGKIARLPQAKGEDCGDQDSDNGEECLRGAEPFL